VSFDLLFGNTMDGNSPKRRIVVGISSGRGATAA